MQKRRTKTLLAYLTFWEGILLFLFPANPLIVLATSAPLELQTASEATDITKTITETPIATTIPIVAIPTTSPTPLITAVPEISQTPTVTIQPDLQETPSPTVTPTITAAPEEDSWKNNRGTITMGKSITHTGDGISTSGTTIKITKGGDFTVSGFLKNGQIYVDATEKVKLRLTEANITCVSGPAIYIKNAKKAIIHLTKGSNNTLMGNTNYADSETKGTIFSNDSLEFQGNGNLVVSNRYNNAIVSDDDICIESGNITIAQAAKNSLHANNNITVDGGTLQLISNDNCMKCKGDIVINGGELNLISENKAISSVGDCTVNGGTITILKATEGIESKANLTINDGSITAITGDDGLNAGICLTINGGTLNLDTQGDGIDSKGTLIVTGGYLVIYSGGGTDGITDCDLNPFIITGGTIIGMGGNTNRCNKKSSTQCAVALSGASVNDVVSIRTQDGTEILHYIPLKNYGTMLFTSPLLQLNTLYTMYINDIPTNNFTTVSVMTVSGGYAYGGGDRGFSPITP